MISAAQLDSNTAFLEILHGIGVQQAFRGLYKETVIDLGQPSVPILIEIGLAMQGTEVLSHMDIVEDVHLSADNHSWESRPKEKPTTPTGEDDPLARGQLRNLFSVQCDSVSHVLSPPLSQ